MKLLITGANGMLGQALRKFAKYSNFEVLTPARLDLDLTDSAKTLKYFKEAEPDAVIHAAARVGGITANIENPLQFLTENLQIDNSVLGASRITKVPNLIYISSSCMYPKNLEKPMRESDLLTGSLESTNEAFALAKIVGTKTVQITSEVESLNWKTFVFSNLYGPYDHFESSRSHVLGAIIEKVCEAKKLDLDYVEMWGDGTARREFTYVDDVAKFMISKISNLRSIPSLLNISSGQDLSIRDYYELVMDLVEFRGQLQINLNKPTGMKRKLMDTSLASKNGWVSTTSLQDGLKETINWYQEYSMEGARK